MTPQKRQALRLTLNDIGDYARPESNYIADDFPHGDGRSGNGAGNGSEHAVLRVRHVTVEAYDDEA